MTNAELIQAIFASPGLLILVVDGSGRIRQHSQACLAASGLTPADLIDHPVWDVFGLPGSGAGLFAPLLVPLLNGEESPPVETTWADTAGQVHHARWSGRPVVVDGAQTILLTGVEITALRQVESELRQVRASLEERVHERTSALVQANEALQTEIAERQRVEKALRESQENLRALFDSARDFVVYRIKVDASAPYGGKVMLVSPSISRILGTANPYRFEEWFTGIHPEDLPRVLASNQRAWDEKVPYNEVARFYNPQAQAWRWVHTISNPTLDDQGQVTHFNGLILDVTEQMQAEQALEQAYQGLEQRVQERTQEVERRRQVAEGLREILRLINSNRPLDEVLGILLGEACRLAHSDAGVIYRFDLVKGLSYTEATVAMPEGFSSLGPFAIIPWGPQRDALERRPSVITDLRERIDRVLQKQDEFDPQIREWARMMRQHFQAYLAIPLIVQEQVYGAISLLFRHPEGFSQEEVDLVNTFGSQAALAIETARLRAHAEEVAIAAERNRIARDLHDAVTQTLFSASLTAEVLPVLLEQKPEEGLRRLEELRRLCRGALAEMRTLLLELKPSALIEAETREILRHLVDAFTGRTQVPVEFSVEGGDCLPADVKVAFYRITQEALNNISKHARAGQVWLHVTARALPGGGTAADLLIRDDGQGFDPHAVSSEHLGVQIMRERALGISAQFELESAPGRGTQVSVHWVSAKP